MASIRTLTLQMNAALQYTDLSKFRGAVIAAVPSHNILFHNHCGSRLRYAYPLVQYKCIGGKAAIVAIGEGVTVMEELFAGTDFSIRLGKRTIALQIESIKAEEVKVSQSIVPIVYQLYDWLPFNEANYEHFLSISRMVERIELLERILTGNILSLFKGLDVFIDFPLHIEIMHYVQKTPVAYKGVKLMRFDVSFMANVLLPNYVGLGRHSSVGAGLLIRKNNNIQY